MGRKQCILCQNIYSSKQEMDEHMRSMLHHRELENLKGRDCGHECRVCKVTVASLTDYANHISSPLHKQRVTAQELGNVQEEEVYFDKELVNLIEKRKELIRQEEAAAKRAQEEARRAKEEARRAKEEEERRRKMQHLQQRWNEANQYVRRKGASWGLNPTSFQPPARDVRGSDWQGAWNGSNSVGGQGWDVQEDPRNWHQQNRQGRSATWHAQEPPNFQSWGPGERSGGSLHSRGGWASKRCDQEGFSSQPRLSNDGSTSSGYNSLQWQQNKEPVMEGLGSGHRMDFTNDQVCPSSFFSNMEGQYQQREGGLSGHENKEGPSTERDRNNGMGPKTFGSNPKLDKAFRWTPYPPTSKLFDSAPHKDSQPNPSEKFPKGPPPHAGVVRDGDMRSRCKPASDPKTSERQSRWDQQQRGHSLKSSRSSSRSSSAQRDSHASSSSGPPKQRPAAKGGPKGRSLARPPQSRPSSSPNPNPKNQLGSASSQDSLQSKSSKHSGSNPKSHNEVLPSEQEQQLSEMLRKAKETLLPYKRSSVDLSTDHRMETVLHIEEEPPVERTEREARENKKSSSNQSVQSVQVSTSTVETRGTATSARKEEECRERAEGGGSADAGPGSDGEVCRGSEAQTSSLGAAVPTANKAGLPPALKRDLTKHISSKSKAGTHEPNLNIARRIRNLSGTRRGDAEKDSGLKPTVRQLISSSGSRRNVNWEQVYQEVCRKKQEQGKGMPRFGIEMVPCEQEGLSQEEDDIPLTEGFQWESLFNAPPAGVAPGTTRKRSLSESSIAPESSLFTSQTSGPRAAMVEGPSRPGRRISEQQGSSSTLVTPSSRYGNRGKRQPEDGTDRQLKARPQTLDEGPSGASQQQPDSVVVDSSSGAEQNDTHGSGKKRRAAGDVPSPEISCPEKTNKRRKTKKSKKERSQVDQLLAVSLREEQLSRDLQTLDNSLIQARAALQAAYIEVQRLLVVKQQVNMEMSTLRSKRIELLQGMQGGLENAPPPRVKEMDEEMALAPAEPHMPPLLSPTTDAAVPSPSQAPQGPVCATPPPSSNSVDAFTQSVVIKQEPVSPVKVDTEPDPVGSIVHGAHSTTPESILIPSHADPALPCQPVAVLARRLSQSLGESADCKESSTCGKAVQTVQMGLWATGDSCLPVDSKPLSFLSPASRRGSQTVEPTDPTASPPHETLPSQPPLPPSPPELRSGKRVRKLKKKKRELRKTQGTEQLDSDTELDGETSRPTRRLHLRRRSSGFQVSTSTSPTATLEDRAREGGEDASGAALPAGEPGQEDSDSAVEVVETRQTAPVEVVNVDTSDSNMDISPASPESEPSCQPTAPDTMKEQPQNLACNEVSSTSEMEVSTVIKTSDSDIRLPLTSLKVKTRSADVLSDCGEDKPTEGAFEGHQETVNAMQVHNGTLYTCSGDRTVKAFNLRSRKCVAVFEGHSTKVNCLVVSSGPSLPQRLYSGSSDQTIRCYSLRTRTCVEQFSLPDRVLCLHSRWNVLYAGLANGSVVTFNLKTNKQVDVFECHGPRAVSCLATAQEGARRILLVGSYDSTISVRDAKSGLLLRTLEGHTKTVLCMEVVNDLVFSGSSDQSVHAHNIHTGQLVRIYKGHSHGVTVVAILGKVMVTACLDKLVRVYELQSHEQLQVYGGHRDMVMCMAVHQSMIYTGCYDGSVQAVKLNLIQNYRCLWHGCSLIFGVQEHLQQHLLSDHVVPNFSQLKCRWKNCDAFFSTRNGSKQGVPKHMQGHAEESQSEC